MSRRYGATYGGFGGDYGAYNALLREARAGRFRLSAAEERCSRVRRLRAGLDAAALSQSREGGGRRCRPAARGACPPRGEGESGRHRGDGAHRPLRLSWAGGTSRDGGAGVGVRPARARERRGEHGALLGVQLAERLDQGAGVQEVPDPREPSRPRARLSSPCIGRDAPSRVVHGQLDRDRPQPDGRSGGRVPRSGGRVRARRLAERLPAAIAGHRRTQGRRPRAQHSAPCQQPAVSRSSLVVTGERPERSPYIDGAPGEAPGPRHLRADMQCAHLSILKRAKLNSRVTHNDAL